LYFRTAPLIYVLSVPCFKFFFDFQHQFLFVNEFTGQHLKLLVFRFSRAALNASHCATLVNRNIVAPIPNWFDFCNFKAAQLKKRSFPGQHFMKTVELNVLVKRKK
jgi:hypothetical protein